MSVWQRVGRLGLFGKQCSGTVRNKMTVGHENPQSAAVTASFFPADMPTSPLAEMFSIWNREGGIGKLFAGSQTACNTQG